MDLLRFRKVSHDFFAFGIDKHINRILSQNGKVVLWANPPEQPLPPKGPIFSNGTPKKL